MPRLTAVLLAGISVAMTTGGFAQVTKPTVTPNPTDRLPAPRNITAKQEQPGGPIRVVWGSVDGAVRYLITRSVPPTPAGPLSLPNSPDTVYRDEDIKAGSTYYYVLSAVNQAGISGLRASAPPVTAVPVPPTDTAKTETASPTAPALAAPTNVVAKPYPYMEPTVTWQSSETRARFLVERHVNNPDAVWEPIRDNSVATGFWKCCEAHDRNSVAGKNLQYRVTAVDTAAPKSRSPAALSNTIVNWPINVDPPVLNELTLRVGESTRLFSPPNRTADLENVQWMSLIPQVASVDPSLGIVTGGYQGRTYIVAGGVVRTTGNVGTWIWRIDVR